MPTDPLQPERCAQLLVALASPERLRIVRFLAGGPHTVGEIAAMLDIQPVNLAHHMNVLNRVKLTRRRKRGRFVVYSLRAGVLDEAVEAGVPKAALDLGCCRLVLPAEPPCDH